MLLNCGGGEYLGLQGDQTSPSNEYSGLISFRIDWFDLLAVQGTHHHHNSKASILHLSAFLMDQLSRT